MRLRDYVDRIRYELKDPSLGREYLRQKINTARRYTAYITKCLQCVSQCESTAGEGKYRVPHAKRDTEITDLGTTFVDLIEVYTCKYDGDMLDELTPRELRIKQQYYTTNGTPLYFALFGGEAQPGGWIELLPVPDTSLKIIDVHGAQLPLPLIYDNHVCELNDVIQEIVIEQVEGDILLKRWHPAGITMLNRVRDKIRSHINLRLI